MKAAVIYESHYGNTRTVAEAIAGELAAEGHQAEIRDVRQHGGEPLQADVMFLGSPIRMGSVSGRVKRYLGRLDAGAWKDTPIALFTTILALPENATEDQRRSQDKYDRGAGRRFADLARSRGLRALENQLWVEVKGMKGPLAETGVESTREFTRETIRSLRG